MKPSANVYQKDCQCADCAMMITFPETYLTSYDRGLKTGVLCLACYESSGDAERGMKMMWEAYAAFKAGDL